MAYETYHRSKGSAALGVESSAGRTWPSGLSKTQLLTLFHQDRLTVLEAWTALIRLGVPAADVNASLLSIMRFSPAGKQVAA